MNIKLPTLTLPAWCADLLRRSDDQMLAEQFSWSALAQGKIEYNAKRILSLSLVPASEAEKIRIRADLLGRGRTHVAFLELSPTGQISGECTCPVGRACGHAVALCLILKQQVVTAGGYDWRRVLQSVAAQHLDLTPPTAPLRAQQLALQAVHSGNELVWQPALKVGTRINTAGISWHSLKEISAGLAPEREKLYEPAQLAALQQIAYTAQAKGFKYSNHLPHSLLKTHSESLLKSCAAAGVGFYLGQQELRLAAEKFSFHLVVEDAPADGLQIRLEPQFAGESLELFDPKGRLALNPRNHCLYHHDDGAGWPRSTYLLGSGIGVAATEIKEFETYFLGNFDSLRHAVQIRGKWQMPRRLLKGWRFSELRSPITQGGGDAFPKLVLARRIEGVDPLQMENTKTTNERQEQAARESIQAISQSADIAVNTRSWQPYEAEFEALEFIENLPRIKAIMAERGEICVISESLQGWRIETTAPEIELSEIESENDWFRLRIKIKIAGVEVALQEIIPALVKQQKYLWIEGKQIARIDDPRLARLAQLLQSSDSLVENGDTVRAKRYDVAEFDEFAELLENRKLRETWKEKVLALTQAAEVPQAPLSNGHVFRNYQAQGFAWLYGLICRGFGALLADDMGLGKTIQILALLRTWQKPGKTHLVIAPTTMLGVWESEAQKFFPDLRLRIIDKTLKKAPSLYQALDQVDVVVTSYALCRLEAEFHAQQCYEVVVLDEAQAVKNPAAQIHQSIRQIPAHAKVAITGTPVENSVMDLWAIMRLVCPGLLPSKKIFQKKYAQIIDGAHDRSILQDLQKRIAPFFLRRTKEQVMNDLPEKIEQVILIPPKSGHKRLYDLYLARERKRVLGLLSDVKANRFQILKSLTRLRQLALDPTLVEIDKKSTGVETNELELLPREESSAKIDYLLNDLTTICADGHSALVFSQFTSYLKLVSQHLQDAGIAHAYLDGSTQNRAEVIMEFTSGKVKVFLISLKAGGTGLTLTQADFVYLLDPWWNPAVEAQAIDRTHRIGQTQKVNVYRLISKGTIEESVQLLQRRKTQIIEAVTAPTENPQENPKQTLAAADIRALLQ